MLKKYPENLKSTHLLRLSRSKRLKVENIQKNIHRDLWESQKDLFQHYLNFEWNKHLKCLKDKEESNILNNFGID